MQIYKKNIEVSSKLDIDILYISFLINSNKIKDILLD